MADRAADDNGSDIDGRPRYVAVPLSDTGPFMGRRIIYWLSDILRSCVDRCWFVTYSAVFEMLVTDNHLHAQAHFSKPLYEPVSRYRYRCPW